MTQKAKQALGELSNGGSAMVPFEVTAAWDGDARIWWARSDDLPGLLTEAKSFPELVAHIRSLAPILVRENLQRNPAGLSVRVTSGDHHDTFMMDA